MSKQKLVLSCDSHALSAYARCPEEHNFAYVKHLETSQTKTFYDTGTLVHLMLALYYKLRRRGYSVDKASMLVATKRFERYAAQFEFSKETRMLVLTRFFEYVACYKNESHVPVGIESGFSEKLFEDKNFIFIYEGRIDWVGFSYIQRQGKVLHFEDHKTRSQNYELDYRKNQFYGYAWVLKQIYGQDYDFWGSVNYFGLQEDKTSKLNKEGKLFERVFFKFSEKEIEQWKQDTIIQFNKIAQSRLFNFFPRTWQCDRKFGVCPYKKICIQPTKWEKQLVIKNPNYYQVRLKKWSAWE